MSSADILNLVVVGLGLVAIVVTWRVVKRADQSKPDYLHQDDWWSGP